MSLVKRISSGENSANLDVSPFEEAPSLRDQRVNSLALEELKETNQNGKDLRIYVGKLSPKKMTKN